MIETIDKFEGEFEFLSNFSPHGFTLGDVYFKTSEHFYQAMKVKVGMVEEFRAIVNAKYPGMAKRMGSKKGYNGFKIEIRPDWEEIKLKVMAKAVTEKFKQNLDLIPLLKATKGKILIEGNHWHDNYWGNCHCEKCEKITGKNMLGITLMFVRDII